jgi:hypothetical protein
VYEGYKEERKKNGEGKKNNEGRFHPSVIAMEEEENDASLR